MFIDRNFARAALATALIALPLSPALAQTRSGPAMAYNGATLHAGTLEVPINKSEVVNVDRMIAKAMIGNDEIADILPITDRSVYVLGKKMGTTSLTLYDSAGRVIAVMDVAVGPDVVGLEGQLRELMPNDRIAARISNESVVLTGMVSSAGAADRAAQLAKAFAGDKVINLISLGSSQQVMLEVRFAEVTRSVNKDIGVQNSVNSRGGSFGGVTGPNSSFTPGTSVTTSTTSSGSTNTSSSNALNGSTGSTSNASLSGTTNDAGTNTNLQGSTGAITGTTETFTNIGSLAGLPMTGAGNAGSFADTSSTGSSSSGSLGGTFNNLTNGIGSTTVGAFATTTTALASILQLGAQAGGFGIFRQNWRLGNLSIQSVLNAMETKGLAKTLAQPTLIALSGERASFLAGGEFPVPVAQSGGNSNGSTAITVEFKPFGVSLGFTPTVLGDNTINLVVEPEVSAIDPAASFTLGNITIPGIRTRRASTTLELRDGESFAIAGLIQKDFETSVRQVPILGSLPIIGALFRSSAFKKGETELLIVVTPHLVAPIAPGQVRLPTDRVKDPSEIDTFLLGEPYHPQELVPVSPSQIPVAPPPGAEAAPAPANPQAANPQASAELPVKKDDDYAY